MKRKGITTAAMALLLCGSAYALRPLPQVATPAGTPLPAEVSTTAAIPAGQMQEREAMLNNSAPAPASAFTLGVNPKEGKATGNAIFNVPATAANARFQLPGNKTVTSVNDLAGQYVMTYKSLVSTLGDGGCSAYVTALGNDSITIHNFWTGGINVKAHVDLATGKLTIPAQYLYNHSTYGDMWLAFCGSDGRPNYNNTLTGTIAADGTLSIESWWGVYVKSGTNAGSYMVVGYDAALPKANATMTCDMFNAQPVTYNVVVTQNFDNQISVLNFGNYGMEVVIDLNRYSSGVIHSQVVRAFPQNADFLSCSVGGYVLNDNGSVSLQNPLANDIYLDTLENVKQTNTISWGCWSALSRGASSYYLGAQTSGKIQTQVPIRFPVLSITEFAGSGTQADPYQIKTRDELILLSQKVQDSKEYNPNIPVNPNYPNARRQVSAFRGKYFKVMNDIDMSGTNFTAIGCDYYQRFGGIFDGDNHVIRNLSVDIQSAYAGLFGDCDTTSVLKNIRLENPDVATTDNYAGALASWSYGSVDNCHVTGGSVIGNGQCVGGLIGSASGGLTNSTVSGMQVAGAGGWCGGLVGQVQIKLENCSATDMTVIGYPGSGTTAGGLAGMILCPAKNLYFSGLMDGYRLGAPENSGIITGTVAGMVTGGSLENAFGVGTVMGRNSYCEVGGVAGRVQNSTVNNCYFRGRVGSYYSRMTGGLVGRVFALTNDGRPVPSTLTNMYCATTETLEDYQYNREKGWAETLGQVEEGALAKAENIYYDSQLFSRKSANGTALTTAQLTSGQLPAGFNASVWKAVKGQYPVLASFQNTPAAQWGASAVLFNEGASVNKVNKNVKLTAVGGTQFMFYKEGKGYKEGYSAKIEGDSLIVTDFGVDTLLFVNGKQNFYYIIKCAPVPFAGSGTADDPYQIRTKQDILSLADFANESQQYFPGSYFLQMNDIDMELDTAFNGIASDAADAHCKFAGIYDGGGHTIHRMYIGGLTTDLSDLNVRPAGKGYNGFIGRLAEDGVLRNINFAADCDLSHTWASVGVAVGVNTGLIENVRNYADITAVSCWVGGITGMNDKPGIIRNCYNAGNVVSGYNSAGGIAGRNNGGIDNCANAGNVEIKLLHPKWTNNKNVCGGISTNMTGGYIRNCLNTGYVYAEGSVAGGIIGSLTRMGTSDKNPVGHNDILYCVSYAAVESPQMATNGAIAGFQTNNNKPDATTRILAYYDDQISMYGAYNNAAFEGMYGLTTARMTSGQPLDSLSTEYWQFDAGMYPVLKTFANEPKLQNARKVIMKLPDNVTVRDMNADATLSANTTWTVNPNTYFKVEGSLLKTGAVPANKEDATVNGTMGNFTRIINITRIPPVPLAGEGTQANPYLITSVTDWNNLAAYINGTHDQFDGQFLKVTADLDFSNTTVSELFLDDADMLNGTLDGDGHTVNFGVKKYAPTAVNHGPIRTIGESGVLQNFVFKGTIESDKSTCGAITGRVYGTVRNVTSEIAYTTTGTLGYASTFGTAYENARFEKCVHKGTLTSGGTYMASLLSDAKANVTMIDCGNEGAVKSSFSGSAPSTGQGIGGLVGSAIAIKMTNCYNKGTMTFAKKEVMYGVGGLIGWLKSSSSNNDSTVLVGCYNTATIEAGFMIGGIVANMDGSATIKNIVHMRDCYNTGDIISTATASKTNGGIGGLMSMYCPGTELLGCYNKGTIMNNNPKQAYAGGIAAYYKVNPSAALPMVIANCHNEGEIINPYNYSGGILGYMYGYTTISDCYNTAPVSAVIGAGGIVGNFSNNTSKIERCYNTGAITCSDSRAGGIAGQATSTGAITECFNVGDIVNAAASVTVNATTKQATKGYGTGGLVGEGGGTMTRCYNLGSVKGLANVGGLIGRPTKNNTIVATSYNAGEIQAPADTCGSLIGIDFAHAGRNWDPAKNSITDCHYLKVDTLVLNTQGTANTQAELIALNLGTEWTSGIAYTYPMLKALQNDAARLFAAQVVPNPAHFSNGLITGSFFVGVPEGVSWTPSIGNLTLNGNKFVWSSEAYNGSFTLTATCGAFKRTVTLNASKAAGVEGLDNGLEIVSEKWYTTAGIEVTAPSQRTGNVYIVVRRYSDGTTSTDRILF